MGSASICDTEEKRAESSVSSCSSSPAPPAEGVPALLSMPFELVEVPNGASAVALLFRLEGLFTCAADGGLTFSLSGCWLRLEDREDACCNWWSEGLASGEMDVGGG